MMSAELNFWMVMLCAPGVVPAVIFYRRHCKERPLGENRFPLGPYVVALLICAFVAFWGGTGWGVSFACRGPSSGNLCGLLPFFVVGPLSSIITVCVLSWLITYFPLQMKRSRAHRSVAVSPRWRILLPRFLFRYRDAPQ